MHRFAFIFLFFVLYEISAQTTLVSAETEEPVSFATISFGDGQGFFADAEGTFLFTKKLYPKVDSLFISALGFKDLAIATLDLPERIEMATQSDQLDEIVLISVSDRKFKEETLKPYLDDDYYKCWLPTIESEIAVYFPNTENQQLTQISSVSFPITLESRDWDKRKKSNADKRPFSTLFKVKFYKNTGGKPGKELTKSNIVFVATEKNGDSFELDVTEHELFIPDTGFFVSLQVLGYTDKNGKLLPNKNYKEIESRGRTVRIPTNFRPLLPFTDEITENRTFIRRIFISNNQWVKFKEGNGIESTLLRSGLNNYGVGYSYRIYKDE